MDLRIYYEKVREVEAKIADSFPIIVSRETADGGKQGTKTEVARRLAAKLIVDGLARLADAAEAEEFLQEQAVARRAAEEAAAAARIQVTVVSSADLDRLRDAGRAKK